MIRGKGFTLTKLLVFIAIIAVLLAVSCTAAAGKVIYVDADAVAEFDGSSWAYAQRTVQDAISVAWYGDEIRVAQGTYRPDQKVSPVGRTPGTIVASGNRAATFELIFNVTFKGGYAGYGESDPNARDFKRYESILSGDLDENDINLSKLQDMPTDPSRSDNSYNVVTVTGTAVLDGFTITGGNGPRGGGIFNRYGIPQIINCAIRGNSVSNIGGGMYNDLAKPIITDCTFTDNYAGDSGGAIGSYNGSILSIENCTFSHNSALYGGGAMHNNDSAPELICCTFVENLSRYGGAIYNERSNLTLTRCEFHSNYGYDYGGGMYSTLDSTIALKNCSFTANQARMYGAGMSISDCDLNLTNCTFAANSAPVGNAFACNSRRQHGRSEIELTNCIIWDGADSIWIYDLSTVDISYSNVFGGWPGQSNIDASPQFLDADGLDNIPGTEDDDLRLTASSPCVDSGDPEYVPAADETDLDGNRRVLGGRIDMGAYEFQALIYVDDDAPGDPGPTNPEISDPQEDGTEAHPYDTIQEAIDMAKDGHKVMVKPGVYGKIDFRGKAITVTGIEGAAVIEEPWNGRGGDPKPDAVTFHTGEGPDSVLKNFIIKNAGMAISLNYGSSPTIRNLTIVDNDFGIAAYENSNPDISNCIFWNNRDGDLFQCTARYSCVQDGTEGEGNISVNPLFVEEAGDDFHSEGDYHLKSAGHRWDQNAEIWIYDHVTSPCIDAGDPASPLGDEPMTVPRDPNNDYGANKRINMGAFGGTSQASMPPLRWVTPTYEMLPPEPNPAQWALNGEPREVSGTSGTWGDHWAQMTAIEATDDSGWVEYFFECTTNSGLSSNWQISREYKVLLGGKYLGHQFRVKIRDLFGNETQWSELLEAR
jgi:parallel beta-helix repeat protein/predicted outer membrane repeat protein